MGKVLFLLFAYIKLNKFNYKKINFISSSGSIMPQFVMSIDC